MGPAIGSCFRIGQVLAAWLVTARPQGPLAVGNLAGIQSQREQARWPARFITPSNKLKLQYLK